MTIKLQPVRVEWIDATVDNGWSTPSERPGNCATVGFLVSRNKNTITVALNHCYEEHGLRWGDTINIPACAVRRVTKLK